MTAAVRRRGDGAQPLLSLRDLHVNYGNIAAIKGLNIDVYPGEIVTLIGSNGAGKSTTLRTISGLLRPRRGEVEFEGRKINGLHGHQVVKRGICQSPEGRRIFPRMTVSENLDLGAFLRNDAAGIAEDRARVLELFPVLGERLTQKAGTLSGGEQQMLAVGRALLGKPRLLLLDEPSMGLAPVLVDLIFHTIGQIRDQGVTVLLVEQNALAALEVADYAYVLESGNLTLQGPAEHMLENDSLTRAYLGQPAAGPCVRSVVGALRRQASASSSACRVGVIEVDVHAAQLLAPPELCTGVGPFGDHAGHLVDVDEHVEMAGIGHRGEDLAAHPERPAAVVILLGRLGQRQRHTPGIVQGDHRVRS